MIVIKIEDMKKLNVQPKINEYVLIDNKRWRVIGKNDEGYHLAIVNVEREVLEQVMLKYVDIKNKQ